MTRLTRNLTIVLLCGLAATSWAQQMTNVRGTVTSFDGQTIVVASREGTPVTVTLPENVNVAGTKAITLADLKPGTPLGVTTIKRADGRLVAIDVRPIPPTARLGLSPFDLQPESTMTNVSVLTQFDGSMVKYIDGSVENCGERIKQEVVFAETWCLKWLLEVSGDGDLKKTAAA